MSMLGLLLALLAQSADDQARALLDKAEEHAREGRYGDARSAYRRIVERFPATDAARVAERRSQPTAFLGWRDVVRHGPSANRVDVVLMGDGYEFEHLKAFDKLAADVPPLFEREEPFREYWSYVNVLSASLVSAENGVDGFGREYDTALGAATASTYAGHVYIDGERVRAALAELPEHDGLAICFVKNGVAGTGGGGYATVGGRDAGTTIHEWGHAFGGLGDEYETQLGKHVGDVRDRPNVSSTDDPKQVPWAHWIAEKHPSIGVYEGAAGRVRGAWKPTSAGCIMASDEQFCPVCREALVLRIHTLVDPIESCSPAAEGDEGFQVLRVGDAPLELHVATMRPASHPLQVRWWILPADHPVGATAARRKSKGSRAPTDRSERGPLAPIDAKPAHVSLYDDDGAHSLRLSANDLEPGPYRVVCRVKDTTKLRGERWPWVLKDERGLLESERVWWIEVPPK